MSSPLLVVDSDLDVEVEEGSGDEAYLRALDEWLPHLTATLQPDLVFFQGGVDIHKCVPGPLTRLLLPF